MSTSITRLVEGAVHCHCQYIGDIVATLLDRMEIIDLSGYLLEED